MTMDDLICSIPVHLSKDSTATIVCKLQRLSNSSSDVVNPFGFWELAELNKPAAGHSIADKSLVLAMQEVCVCFVVSVVWFHNIRQKE